MQFIRDNRFLAILVGVFLLSVIIFVPVKMKLSSTYEERVAIRQKIMDENAANDRRPYVNAATVANGAESLQEIKDQATAVGQVVTDKNRYKYTPLMLSKKDGTEVAAFPINRTEYDQSGLGRQYTQRYREWIENKISELEPTTVPSDEEIKNETEKQLKRLNDEEELRKRLEAREEAEAGTSGADSRRPPGETPDLTGGAAQPVKSLEERAKDIGTLIAKKARANKGRIYVDINTIQLVFPAINANPQDTELWNAEVSRWVFMDILEAIKQTNELSLHISDTSIEKPVVMKTAIKRLVGMAVDRNYITEPVKTGTGGATAGPHGAMPPVMIPSDTGGGAYGQPTSKKPPYLSLTNRVSCQLYDVVHYDFTVVMSVNYLQTLQKNLMKQNLHTILGIKIVEVIGKTDTASATTVNADENLYYYGQEPIMKVTISGELLLLTDWTRGEFDNKGQELPGYPALVPVDVLKQEAMRSALRPEDQKRVNDSIKTR